MKDVHMEALVQAAVCLGNGETLQAETIIQTYYPFVPVQREKRRYSLRAMLKQFFKDGFVDRYSGKRLIHPGMLRIMSIQMAEVFPYEAH